jgi:hypothetical protein
MIYILVGIGALLLVIATMIVALCRAGEMRHGEMYDT